MRQVEKPLMTQRILPHNIKDAVEILNAGGLLALPTETVYGLGADARRSDSVAAIYAAKGRPDFNPLIVHVCDFDAAQTYGVFDPLSAKLAQRFWPGPLTLVVPLRDGHGLSTRVTAGLDTIALRVPAAPLAHAVLSAFDGPIAAPSANRSGSTSPTTADHVLGSLDGKIDAVLDGGGCSVGLESTIITIRNNRAYVLRAGGLANEQIRATLNTPLCHDLTPDRPSAPGQMLRHYAPRTKLIMNCTIPHANAIHIGFGAIKGDLNLSANGDLAQAAANLFTMMHRADELASQNGAEWICVAPIPKHDLGIAINDRLKRAAQNH